MIIRLVMAILLALYASASLAEDKKTLLMQAVDERDFEQVRSLVESGVDVNEKGVVGFTALLIAAGWGDVEMVDYLIDHGADINVRSSSGFGVIHRAAMNKNPAVLEYLINNYKFDLVDRGDRYCSPLRYSINYNALQRGGSIGSAQILIDNGAKESINWKCNGYTLLMISVLSEDVVIFLLDNGADVTVKTVSGKTAYDMASEQGASAKVIGLLEIKDLVDVNEKKESYFLKGVYWELKTNENRREKYTEKVAGDYCKSLILDARNSWRLPTEGDYKNILSSKPYTEMVVDGIDEYYMDPSVFNNMTAGTYWTVLGDGSLAGQSISRNKIRSKGKNSKYYVRCVHD